jgi:hypothetical protein
VLLFAAPAEPLDASVVDAMIRFATHNRLRRAALQVCAQAQPYQLL